MGVITKAVPSKDDLAQRMEVKVTRQQAVKTILRPTSKVILLFSPV